MLFWAHTPQLSGLSIGFVSLSVANKREEGVMALELPTGNLNTCSMLEPILEGRKEGNILFNDALNTFYLLLYGIRHMVKDHSDSERGNLLPPHGLLLPISSKSYFICIIPHTG